MTHFLWPSKHVINFPFSTSQRIIFLIEHFNNTNLNLSKEPDAKIFPFLEKVKVSISLIWPFNSIKKKIILIE